MCVLTGEFLCECSPGVKLLSSSPNVTLAVALPGAGLQGKGSVDDLMRGIWIGCSLIVVRPLRSSGGGLALWRGFRCLFTGGGPGSVFPLDSRNFVQVGLMGMYPSEGQSKVEMGGEAPGFMGT